MLSRGSPSATAGETSGVGRLVARSVIARRTRLSPGRRGLVWARRCCWCWAACSARRRRRTVEPRERPGARAVVRFGVDVQRLQTHPAHRPGPTAASAWDSRHGFRPLSPWRRHLRGPRSPTAIFRTIQRIMSEFDEHTEERVMGELGDLLRRCGHCEVVVERTHDEWELVHADDRRSRGGGRALRVAANNRRSPAPPQRLRKRTRIGPLAVDGSTGLPFWVTSATPCATRRRAAMRVDSMSCRQPPVPFPTPSSPGPPTARATSLGQIDADGPRSRSMLSIASSSRRSAPLRRARLHAFEQYLTPCQSRSHFLRHSMIRPQRAHAFGSRDSASAG